MIINNHELTLNWNKLCKLFIKHLTKNNNKLNRIAAVAPLQFSFMDGGEKRVSLFNLQAQETTVEENERVQICVTSSYRLCNIFSITKIYSLSASSFLRRLHHMKFFLDQHYENKSCCFLFKQISLIKYTQQ